MFNFKSLVSQFGKVKPEKLVKTDGYYDYDNGGVWVEGNVEEIEFDGAVVPLSEENLKDQHTYTTEDKKLYCYDDLEPNSSVKHKGILYTVMSKKDYSDFDADLRIYILKRGGK